MRSYRRHAAFVAAFLAGYALLGAAFRFTRPNGEVFPVFSWTLFLFVPNAVHEYEVRVLAAGGEELPEPVSFHDARGVFPHAGDVRANRVIQDMGHAAAEGDEARLAELRALFERRYLGAERAPVRYELARLVYAPLERWRSGAVRERARVRAFAFAPDSPRGPGAS